MASDRRSAPVESRRPADIESAIIPGYMSGFGITYRPQLAAEGQLRPLCRTAFRFTLHRAAGD